MPLKLGFLGTGAITAAMVKGLCGGGERYSIQVSPRNAAVADTLARSFPEVTVAASNQEVADACEIAVIAVRPPIAAQVLSELRFRADHIVISLVSGYSVQRIRQLVQPAGRVSRAVPLPSAALRRSPTAIYPRDPASMELFTALGAAIEVGTEAEFDTLSAATATMAAYFAFADGIASWLTRQGIPEATARDYIARIFAGLSATAMQAPAQRFDALAAEHTTPGGINQQVLAGLRERGVYQALSDNLDAVLRRVTAGTRQAGE